MVKTHDIINTIEFPAASKDFVILESLMGSTSAAASLYIKVIITSFIIGYNNINTITIRPIELIAFFIIREYPATEAIASEKVFPTIGIKLSIANLAVFNVTASSVFEVMPLIVKRAINTVTIIP